MVVRTPIFGIAAVALLPRKDNIGAVILNEVKDPLERQNGRSGFYRHTDP